MGDLLASMNSRTVFTSITAGGNAVWLSGQDVRQYQVTNNGAIRLGTNAAGQVYGSAAVGAAMERIVQTTRGGHVLETDLSAVAARSMQAESLLRNALKPASDPLFGTAPATGNYNANNDPKLRYTDPNNPATTIANTLAQQLQIVARMIEAQRQRRHRRAAPGVLRQHGRLRHARRAERQPCATDGAPGACAALLRRHAGGDGRAATRSPPSPPATSAAPSPATATAPTTAGARTTS